VIDGHVPNFARLSQVDTTVDRAIYVDDWWGKNVTQAMLADPHTLAVYGSGSFTDWVNIYTQPDWRAWLEPYGQLLATTSVPVLAICGSHQLVAASLAGWGAVGHIEPADGTRVAISDEADGVLRVPDPRIGEVGVYPFTPTADPLFAGLDTTAMWFVESHHDEVIDGRYDGGFQPIASAARDIAESGSTANGTLVAPDERSVVEALRYTASDRVLYTLQFHPELPGDIFPLATDPTAYGALADTNGAGVITNFVAIARQYLQSHRGQ
jgi:GMP synthase-like glutamine amidotransferase